MFSSLKNGVHGSMASMYRQIRAGFLSIGLPRTGKFDQSIEERRSSEHFSIVMPVFDAPPLARCLASVERYAPDSEVILIDDGSTVAQTKATIAEFVSRNRWKLVQNDSAQGHSRASEAGARLATRPYLCLLNSDTILTPQSWSSAREAFETDQKIAITGPSTSHASTPQVVRRAELCRHHWNDSQVFAFAQSYVSKQPARSWVNLHDVGGFALFIRRELWEELEGFDPNLPHYGNEVELCKRVSKRGLKIIWTRNSYIHHLGGESYSNSRYGPEFITENSRTAQDYIDRKHR